MAVLPILGQNKTMSENMCILNCLTIESTSYKNCFQRAGVLLTELLNENALSFEKNL